MNNEYKEEMGLDNPLFIRILKELIQEMVRKEIKNMPFNRMLPATVTSVGSGVASVKLMLDDDIVSDLPNKTGVTLNVGNEVYIEAINGSMSNLYICLKK